MTKPKAKQPLESFDPRLMQLLINGARQRIVLPFVGEGQKALAHQFQRRLHTLRSRMRQENHEHSTLVTRCVTRLFWGLNAVQMGLVNPQSAEARQLWKNDHRGDLGAFLIIEPVDAKFDHILDQIKINPSDNLPEPPPPLSSEEQADLDNFMKTLPGFEPEPPQEE